jgi:hypothetical protein
LLSVANIYILKKGDVNDIASKNLKVKTLLPVGKLCQKKIPALLNAFRRCLTPDLDWKIALLISLFDKDKLAPQDLFEFHCDEPQFLHLKDNLSQSERKIILLLRNSLRVNV